MIRPGSIIFQKKIKNFFALAGPSDVGAKSSVDYGVDKDCAFVSLYLGQFSKEEMAKENFEEVVRARLETLLALDKKESE